MFENTQRSISEKTEHELSSVPPELAEYAAKYEAMRKRKKKSTLWPEYAKMLAYLQDKSLTFQAIAIEIGTKRENVRQICNRFFPGVRPTEDRRTCGTRQPEQTSARRRDRAADAVRQTDLYKRLQEHARNANFRLGLVWHRDLPLRRVVLYEGVKHYVMYSKSLARLSENGLYTHAAAPRRESVGDCEAILVVVDVKKPLRLSKLYRITTEEFYAANASHVLIRQNVRQGGCRTPELKIDWNRNHLVSKLE